MRFARNVEFRIKDGREQEFDRLFNKEVLPILNEQDGFENELTLVDGESRKAMGISFWTDRDSATRYQNAAYPKVLEKLQPVLDGTPSISHYKVGPTTLGR